MEGARRLVSGSNTKWQIKILPTSNGDVTIVLPITEDCTADGAVCTGARKLSNRLEIIVSGPTSQQTSQQRQENTAATGSPTISGIVQVGQTLAASTTGIADTDGLTNAAYSYQWIANDGSSDSDIADATASAYTLVAGDAGKTIKVKVTFTDDGGNEETLTSATTTEVTATVPGAPGSLSVSVNDTGKLDVSWSPPESNGGSSVTGYRVQWREAPDSWDTPADVSETTVTGTSHTVTGLTDGVEYTFRVFAVNSAGDSSATDDESGISQGNHGSHRLVRNRGRCNVDPYFQRGLDRNSASCGGDLHGKRGGRSARGEHRSDFGEYGDLDPGFRRHIHR